MAQLGLGSREFGDEEVEAVSQHHPFEKSCCKENRNSLTVCVLVGMIHVEVEIRGKAEN